MARKKQPVGETNMAEATATGKGPKVKRIVDNGFKVKQTVELHPSQVELTDKFRGRSAPVPESNVIELAERFRANGQQQAIQVREKEGEPGKYECIFGNTRLRAANKAIEGYNLDEKTVVPPQPNFKIRCEVVECDDETAFVHNVVENAVRTQCSAIDNALNQKRLRDEFGMSDVAIAGQYGYSSSASVNRLKKLLDLDQEFQTAIHDGTLTANAGFLLAGDVEPALRTRVYLAAVDIAGGSEKIGEGDIKKAIKKVNEEVKTEKATQTADKPAGEAATTPATSGESATAATSSGPPSEKSYDLSMKEFKSVLNEIKGDAASPAHVVAAMDVILSTLAGVTQKQDFAVYFVENLKPTV